MSQLTPSDYAQIAAYWANQNFVQPGVTANFATDQLANAASTIDAAFDTTLNAAIATLGTSTLTLAAALNQIIPAPFSGATAQQKSLLVSYVLMRRAGII